MSKIKNLPNILFIVADQFRCDALNWVDTPNLDRLSSESVVFNRHHTTVVPCGPSRASMLTSLYAFNHKSYLNGIAINSTKPVAHLGLEVRKAGVEPLLFGYTDFTQDSKELHPSDPDVDTYEGVAPGFREVVDLRFETGYDWIAHLLEKGYELPRPLPKRMMEIFAPQKSNKLSRENIRGAAIYTAEDSDTAYLTDRTLALLEARRDSSWFAHVNYVRPHPPFVAPAPYNTLIKTSSFPKPRRNKLIHPFTDLWQNQSMERLPYIAEDKNKDIRSISEADTMDIRSVYLGLIAELDHHIGRLLDWLEKTKQKDNTVIIFTSDHGDMLGDKNQWGKISVFEPAFHVPLIIRHPSYEAKEINQLTQSIDVMPTILEILGVESEVRGKIDGLSLLPFFTGSNHGRKYSISEMDFANYPKPLGYKSSDENRAIIFRKDKYKYIQFKMEEMPSLLFDLESDPFEDCDLMVEDGALGKSIGEKLNSELKVIYKN